jgi:hypothetical protein
MPSGNESTRGADTEGEQHPHEREIQARISLYERLLRRILETEWQVVTGQLDASMGLVGEFLDILAHQPRGRHTDNWGHSV